MLRQHYAELLKILETREIVDVFCKRKVVTEPIVKRTVIRRVAEPQPQQQPPKSAEALGPRSPAAASTKTSAAATPGMSTTRAKASHPPQSGKAAPGSSRPSAKQAPKTPVVRDDLEPCKYCSRRFAADRLQVHEEICAKTTKKKRRLYDATKHRVQGTELEPYVKKGGGGRGPSTATRASAKGHSASGGKQGDWRRKHEEFISAIRAAKQAQQHVAKGGKLSDLPPPPPSVNPDYVQCPHCGRRFNEAAAARHIPKCASYEFNKPKPGAASRAPPAARR